MGLINRRKSTGIGGNGLWAWGMVFLTLGALARESFKAVCWGWPGPPRSRCWRL